jgi:uncharacterized membrane protein YhhN
VEPTHYFFFAVISVSALLLSTYYRLTLASGLFKAITAFILWFYCYQLYTLIPSPYAKLILIAISCGVIGDLLLIGNSTKLFLAGMIAFAAGHLSYCLGFLQFAFESIELISAMGLISLIMYFVFRWLQPKIPGSLKLPVIIYMLILGLMCALALSVGYREQLTLAALGATLFMVSDLFVATYRFNQPRFADKLIGLPLYFGGQFVLVSSILQQTT